MLLYDNPSAAAGPSLARVIDQAQTKIVKIYGAGGFRGMEGYQSGFVISAEGHVLTALSYVLDTDRITVTLNDGRRYDAKLLGGDPRLEVAVLKIEATNLPHFDLSKAVPLTAGTRILALSNLFNVAMGDEPASVQSGTVSVVTRLEGRRGVFETPYHGPIYVLDVATNNPGASGGALLTLRGEIAGVLGKELRNSLNNTWLSYAVPIDQLRQSVDEIKSGKFIPLKELPPEKKPAHPMDPGFAGHQPRARRPGADARLCRPDSPRHGCGPGRPPARRPGLAGRQSSHPILQGLAERVGNDRSGRRREDHDPSRTGVGGGDVAGRAG